MSYIVEMKKQKTLILLNTAEDLTITLCKAGIGLVAINAEQEEQMTKSPLPPPPFNLAYEEPENEFQVFARCKSHLFVKSISLCEASYCRGCWWVSCWCGYGKGGGGQPAERGN